MPVAPEHKPVFGKTAAGLDKPAVQSAFGIAPTMKFGVVKDKDVGAPPMAKFGTAIQAGADSAQDAANMPSFGKSSFGKTDPALSPFGKKPDTAGKSEDKVDVPASKPMFGGSAGKPNVAPAWGRASKSPAAVRPWRHTYVCPGISVFEVVNTM